MFQIKVVVKIKTHVIHSILFQKNHAVNKKMWKIWHSWTDQRLQYIDIRFACWITEAINTHSQYVLLIDFPHQQLLRKRSSVLRFHVHCLSCFLVRVDSCIGYGKLISTTFRHMNAKEHTSLRVIQ
jgi:hypothetical protein